MSFEFTCPYCFRLIKDTNVLFRSDKVTFPEKEREPNTFLSIDTPISMEALREEADSLLPDNYDTWDEFMDVYGGEDKEEILRQRDEILNRNNYSGFAVGIGQPEEDNSNFFDVVEHDPVYENFWRRFTEDDMGSVTGNAPLNIDAVTTERNPLDKILNGRSYKRKLLDPKNPVHRKYLIRQDGGASTPSNTGEEYFVRDGDGMVKMVQLTDSAFRDCDTRVCPHCHNPLPDNYGKHNVKFIALVGIAGSGKTVYISQLLRDMRSYVQKVGLSAMVNCRSVRLFGDENPVRAGVALPASTLSYRFEQPLFYELTHSDGRRRRITETLVMYDVAGENFIDKKRLSKFAPFIKHAHGLIFLIDPEQLESVKKGIDNDRDLVEPATVLDESYHLITESQSSNEQCSTPVAICLSKIDEIQWLFDSFDPELWNLLIRDVESVPDINGYALPVFNAHQFNPIFEKLLAFFKKHDMPLATLMHENFSSYKYFAFSALGCPVKHGKAQDPHAHKGVMIDNAPYPVGPVVPKRIEEPLLWLLHEFGYIGENEPLIDPDSQIRISCERCGSEKTELLPEDEREFIIKEGFFRRRKEIRNLYCAQCGHTWYDARADAGGMQDG